MSGAVEQSAHVGLSPPRDVDHENAALGLVPHDPLEGYGGARFARSQAVWFGDGAHRGTDADVYHLLAAACSASSGLVLGPFGGWRFGILVACSCAASRHRDRVVHGG